MPAEGIGAHTTVHSRLHRGVVDEKVYTFAPCTLVVLKGEGFCILLCSDVNPVDAIF